MAVKGQNSCTLSTITDVKSIYIYHLLVPSTTVVTNNMAPKDATTDNPGNPPGASSITITYLGDNYVWTISEPGINIQTNDIGTLYYIECTLFSDNTFDWGPIMTSSSYEAAKQAFNKATIVSNLVGDSPQHFWWLTSQEGSHPAGAYITYVSQESFKSSPNNQPNLLLQAEGISLRDGLITKAQMTSTGLEILEGGIKGGQAGGNGFIYLSTIDYPLREYQLTSDIEIDNEKDYYIIENNKYTKVESPTIEDINIYYELEEPGVIINGYVPQNSDSNIGKEEPDPAWREIIGTNFGIDSQGNLYANNANLDNAIIEGAIIASSLKINSGEDVYDIIDTVNTTNSLQNTVNNSQRYITTEVNNNGIQIHPRDDVNNGVIIGYNTTTLTSSPNIQIKRDGDIIASYGETTTIGNESGFHISITANYKNTNEGRVSFYRDNINEIAYMSGDSLYINKSVVVKQMDVGLPIGLIDPSTGETGKGQWSWKVHENTNGQNNLYLKWLG